jgi:hypothetical protein
MKRKERVRRWKKRKEKIRGGLGNARVKDLRVIFFFLFNLHGARWGGLGPRDFEKSQPSKFAKN